MKERFSFTTIREAITIALLAWGGHSMVEFGREISVLVNKVDTSTQEFQRLRNKMDGFISREEFEREISDIKIISEAHRLRIRTLEQKVGH